MNQRGPARPDPTGPDPTGARPALDVESLRTSLDPVRRAMLADASVEADRIVTEARARADSTIDAARDEVRTAVEHATRRAQRARAASAAVALGEARRDAHRTVLRARAEAWNELVDRVVAGVDGLRDDPRYPALAEQRAGEARSQLGDDATIEEHPDGGIVARSGPRRVDYRLPVLARRALQTIAGERDGPWT